MATSGTLTRSWLRDGQRHHHLVDPATGRSAESPWTCVTVAATSCLVADVAAKAAFLNGDDGPEWLDDAPSGAVPPGRYRHRDEDVGGASNGRVARRRVMSTQTIWYAERAAGVVSYVLVTVLVVLGLALSNRVRTRRWPMFAIEDIHRFVGILAAVFIALHVSLLAVDSFMPFTIGQILVPFTSSYRPLATGLGTVALELLVAVAVANALRRRIPFRLWRGIHYAGFAVWGAATVHGLTAGSDRHDVWLLALYLVAVTAVLAGLAFRISASRPALGHAIGVGAAGAIVIVAILAVLLPRLPPLRPLSPPRSLQDCQRRTAVH